MADTFFGFSTELPQFEDEKGEILGGNSGGYGEHIDSLNDDTFGTGALEGDWESAHKKLAGLADEIRAEQKQKSYNTEISSDPEEDFLEEAITKFVLDEGIESPEREESPVPYRDSYGGKSQAVPIKPARASVWAGSPVASPTEQTVSPTLEQLISPSTNIWSMQYQHGKENINRGPQNISHEQHPSASPATQQKRHDFSPDPHLMQSKCTPGLIRLEDLERGLTGDNTVTSNGTTKHNDIQEREVPTHVSSPYMRQPGTPYSVRPPPGFQIHPAMSPGMPVPIMQGTPPRGFLPPHLQRGPPPGFPRPPFQSNGHPRWNMMTPPNIPRPRPRFYHTDPGHLNHRGMNEHRYTGQQGYHNNHYQAQRHYDNRRNHFLGNSYVNRESQDEYAGLMTQKEKEWLIKIQLLQLTSVNPDLDDYYYQKYTSSKTAKDRSQWGEGVEQRQDRGGDVAAELPHFPHREERRYKTVEFEGSLGKVSVGSVNHPRQIVDNPRNVKSFYHDKSVSGSQKDSRRKSSVLLTIESIYNILLLLETLQKKMISSSKEDRNTLLMEREQHIDEIFDLVNLKRSDQGTEIEDDLFMQMMTYRKGKTLLQRILPIFKKEQGELVLLSITKNAVALIKKDIQEEVLLHSISTICRSIHLSSPSVITKCLKNMVFETSQSKTLVQIVTNKFGISMLTALLQRGLDIKHSSNDCTLETQTVWDDAVEIVSKEVQEASTAMLSKGLPATITLLQFLALHTNRQTAALLQEHLRLIENNKEV